MFDNMPFTLFSRWASVIFFFLLSIVFHPVTLPAISPRHFLSTLMLDTISTGI